VHFVRLLDADRAVMHARASVTLPGHTRPSPGRESMQLFVAVREEGAWRIAAVQNSRRLTLERQQLLDHLDDLPRALQARVGQLVASFGARAVNPPE
ncbi:MAG TPA: SgcJ/EcaC family oxidoreductase, partial [Acidimicrobiales bacterium]